MIAMGLGPFRFSIDGLLLRQIERKLSARHVDVPLVGRAPASQFLGPGRDAVTLPIQLYPVALPGTGLIQIEGLRQMCDLGTPLMLVAGTGRVLGRYTIREIEETRDYILENGVSQRVDARIEIARYVPIGGVAVGGVFTLFN